MSSLEIILAHIPKLTREELDKVLRLVWQRHQQNRSLRRVISKFRGSVSDVWGLDAQTYINEERDHDRS